MLRIPKIAYFYWGGKVLPYLRYLSVYSFKKYNPDWKIKLYVPEKAYGKMSWTSNEQKYTVETNDAFDLLKDVDIEIVPHNNEISEVIKSDLLRWHLLSVYGGLWSDMDIIYFKPVSAAFSENDKYDTYVCWSKEQKLHSIGFLMSAPGSETYALVNQLSKERFNPKNYQSVGNSLLHEVVGDRVNIGSVANIPMHVVYPVTRIDTICNRHYSEVLPLFSDSTIGLHWYAGHHMLEKYVNEIGTVKHENIIGYLTEKVINV